MNAPREFTRSQVTHELVQRFLAKTCVEGECLIWTGALNSKGRPSFGVGDAISLMATRVAFVIGGGELLPAHTVTHKACCKNRRCVRFEHIEQLPRKVWARRWADRITACKHGHPLGPDNIRIDKRGKRVCLACARQRSSEQSKKDVRSKDPKRREYLKRQYRKRKREHAVGKAALSAFGTPTHSGGDETQKSPPTFR